MSRKKTRSNDVDSGGPRVIPQIPVNKFLEHVEARAWTDAEKELDIIRQKSDNSQWSRGYVKALDDYFTLLGNMENHRAPAETPPPQQATLDQSTTSTDQGK